ncbi:MAG: STAS domain-containing protein [Caulobacteraceae bacterium]
MGEPNSVRLPEVLDIIAARPLAAEILSQRGSPLTLDASRVQRLGGLCLQVLLSAHSTWSADGQAFFVSQPSAEFIDGVTQFGAPELALAQRG